jgi:hypothetical protein
LGAGKRLGKAQCQHRVLRTIRELMDTGYRYLPGDS